jgi:hypothetical protein
MIWLRLSSAQLAWALEAARICLLIFGCGVGGWALGFGMRYRRGVNDITNGTIGKPDHRLNED